MYKSLNREINNAVYNSDRIENELSFYSAKTINDDGSIYLKNIDTPYFLLNDKWDKTFFESIPQLKEQAINWKYSSSCVTFPFNNTNIKNEIKFVIYNKIFQEEWSLGSLFGGRRSHINILAKYINEKHPRINSLLDLDMKKESISWLDWLNSNSTAIIITRNNSRSKITGKTYYNRSQISAFLELMYNYFLILTDHRVEWEKDKWDVRNLIQYGIKYNQSADLYTLRFDKITNSKLRENLKKYLKQRMIANNNFSWSAARNYMYCLPNFINFISEIEPEWNDFKKLDREHIVKYIEWLHSYSHNKINYKNKYPNGYINKSINTVNKYLQDLQAYEYDIAPERNVLRLILPSDRPTQLKKPYDQINYVPDLVLDQLFQHINKLDKDVIPVVLTMLKTGLRISDAVGLKQDCLIKLNNKYWIETDIKKTYVVGHKIPIDDDLAYIIAVLIDNSKKISNNDNNPDHLLFVRYTGRRKGKPYRQGWISEKLNVFAIDYNITDELGKIYHFKNHAFRHSYAMKMLNGGADILTVQELMAHATPEMTLRYARILEDTKRKAFDNAVKQGVFSFDESSKLRDENDDEIPADVLNMLWTNHKINAIDTPYGTCLQRTNGNCKYSKQPPCLTCNVGNPCKDLCIGAFEGDTMKYEILINSTKSMIESAKTFSRLEMVKENEELLSLYENIYSKISSGNIIYSRLDRLKKGASV